jgi:uncharacterized protein YhfF
VTALESFSFGDNPEMADWLCDLVINGNKRATCWSVVDGQQTEVGKRMIVLDGKGTSRAIVETVELTLRRFCDVDQQFALDEGEGDETLDSWRAGHQAYFERNGGFAPDMMLWCERFTLVCTINEAGVAQ